MKGATQWIICSFCKENEPLLRAFHLELEKQRQFLCADLGVKRIRFHCVAPGPVKTELIDKVIAENGNRETMEELAERAMLSWKKPEDIANVCAFLLSDAASAVTASVFHADSGYQ